MNWKLPNQDTQTSDDEEEVLQDGILQEENRDPIADDFVTVYLTDTNGQKCSVEQETKHGNTEKELYLI